MVNFSIIDEQTSGQFMLIKHESENYSAPLKRAQNYNDKHTSPPPIFLSYKECSKYCKIIWFAKALISDTL